MTADDIARDLMANGLEDTLENALVSAAKQGQAFMQGKTDALVERYDNAYAEWRISCDEHGPYSTEALRAHQVYLHECMELAPLFAEAVGREDD